MCRSSSPAIRAICGPTPSCSCSTRGRPQVWPASPPTTSAPTGQLWGNPIYRWEAVRRTGYAWWVARFRACLAHMDVVRIDHFRGFASYWEIPAGVRLPSRANGCAARASICSRLQEALGTLAVDRRRSRGDHAGGGSAARSFRNAGHAGPPVLPRWPAGSPYRPSNYFQNTVVYTGTNDNDTTLGWFADLVATRNGGTPRPRLK